MYISDRIYSAPLDETTWWMMNAPHGKTENYYLFRIINNKKERIFLGKKPRDKKRIENKIREYETKQKLPKQLVTNFDTLVLVEVCPSHEKSSRQSIDPSQTKWVARRLNNSGVQAYYLYRRIWKKNERIYLGVNLDPVVAGRKIKEKEEKLGLDEKYRTDTANFLIEVKDSIP